MTTVDIDDDSWALLDATDLPRLEPVPKEPRKPWIGRLAKRGLIIATVLLAVLFLHARVVTSVIYEQRQHHLSAAADRPKSSITTGDAVGYLQIPKIGVNVAIIEGVTIDNLRGGPAHLSDSALPGDAGPMVIYGHRSLYGGPFRRTVNLVSGDEIVAQARNGGPIVQYVVDRVERHTRLADVALDKPDKISYALLVTTESGFFDRDEVIVVARALPVTDADPAQSAFGDEPGNSSPLGFELLLGNASVVGAVLAWQFLRHRVGAGLRSVVVTPLAAFASVALLQSAEWLVSLTR